MVEFECIYNSKKFISIRMSSLLADAEGNNAKFKGEMEANIRNSLRKSQRVWPELKISLLNNVNFKSLKRFGEAR